MEVLLKLAYSVILTLLRFHIFSKLVTFGEKFGFLARRSESQNCATEIGGESPPEAFAAEEFRDEDEVCNCDKDAIEEEEGTGCLDGNLVGQGRFDRVQERAREPFDESSVREIAREIEKHSDETECGEDEDDDDWVGIERSELEMRFGSAMVFVESTSKCDRVSALASDLKTKLYGLHKIATQGPCLEPQPMVLKVSARAKWNAWQQLGEMSPEMAMEQYVSLLSESVPRWMENDIKGGEGRSSFGEYSEYEENH